MSHIQDVLLSQRFLPEFGGSIRWMYEVYRRWPRPVDVITHDYYSHPPNTPEFPGAPQRPASGDHVTDANLRMDRRDIFLHDWGLERPGRWVRYARMASAVRARLKRCDVVRVHATHAVPEVACLTPLKRLVGDRLRIVCYAHGEEINACLDSRQLRFLMWQAHRIVDVMIVNSDYTRQVASEHIDPARIEVIHPGVDLAEFAPARELGRRWRREQGLEDRLIVATVGRLDPRKNQRAVLEAVASLSDRFPELVYLVAGDGRERPALEALARERGVADRVRFLGNVDQDLKLAVFGAADVFAMPAVRDGPDVEGFGMVFLEAAACGTPSVAGCEGGQAQAVREGETGRVVDGTHQLAVTEAIGDLLSDAVRRQRLGEAALAHAASFDWPLVVNRTWELVESRTGAPAGSPAVAGVIAR